MKVDGCSSMGVNVWIWMARRIQNIQAAAKQYAMRNLLAHLGSNVYIHPSVTFNWPDKIYISDECKLYQGVYLNARSSKQIGIHLGKGVKIHEYTCVDPYDGFIELDDYAGIGHHCVIGGHGGLKVGKYSMISGLTYIVPANHIFNKEGGPYMLQGETKNGITIGDNVWIGAGCIILDGVTIGDNAVVGAGTVVSKSIPANVLAVGVPARVIKEL